MKKHGCGGELEERDVYIAPDENSTRLVLLPGLVCTKCKEEFISAATARALLSA